MLLSKSALRGNRCSESHGLLKGKYEAFPLIYIVFSRLWQYLIQGKGKVKCTLVQALSLCTGCTAHRGSRGIALPFHDHDIRRG